MNLGTAASQADALALYDALRAAGYAAEILPALEAEKRVYIVRIRHLPSKAEAQALANRLRGKHGVAEPEVTT
ncbi:Sporulation related domain protein [compost metagenome]